ncbi:MAG: hypothetical protein CL608_08820 [Anaerolineaceae bacterium]|nr:hypothetical protein [Anaerolineaceae bacterium]
MTALFTKPIENLVITDIERLIEEGYPEGTYVEYKRELPSRRPNGDPWLEGSSSISDYARNQILEEVVAFANGQGGNLILGLAESDEKPPRAAAISPLPRCAELAEKIRLQARDCISPKLPLLKTKEIVVDDMGAGLVVINVPQSRAAPHRLEHNAHCYLRRNDRSEKMTMREIQELTIQRSNFLEEVDNKFVKSHEKFQRLLKNNFGGSSAQGIRVTLIPVSSEIWVNRVYGYPEFEPLKETENILLDNSRKSLNLFNQFPVSANKPLLRGAQYMGGQRDRYQISQEVYCDGTIEFFFTTKWEIDGLWNRIYPEWVYSLLINAVKTAFRFREEAGFSEVEYGLEVEINATVSSCRINSFTPDDEKFTFNNNPIVFPRLSIGSKNELREIIEVFHRDLWDSAGVMRYPNFELEISEEVGNE